MGNIGINASSNINSPLTIKLNSFISTNSSTGFLGLIGGNVNTDTNTVASRILLNSNDNNGTVKIHAGNITSGNISLYTANDIEGFTLKNDSTISIFSTQMSNNSSTGSVVLTGGMSIRGSENATSTTSGGGLTIMGGISVKKDAYIGGNLVLDGVLVSGAAITYPTLTGQTYGNCSLVAFNNIVLSSYGTSGILTLGISITPDSADSDCDISFVLPDRITNLTNRLDVITSVSGFTDNTNIIPLYNVIGFGETGTLKVKVKFQSVSTNTHYLQMHFSYLRI
jgi:hypothetical protein